MMDLPAGFENRVRQFLDGFPDALKTFDTLITGNTIWQNRTKEIGIISREDAIDWGLTGPSLRGSGVELDIRRQIRIRVTKHTISKCRSNTKATFGHDSLSGCVNYANRPRSSGRPGSVEAGPDQSRCSKSSSTRP